MIINRQQCNYLERSSLTYVHWIQLCKHLPPYQAFTIIALCASIPDLDSFQLLDFVCIIALCLEGFVQNWNAYKAHCNKCILTRRKTIRNHFTSLCSNSGIPNKNFWESVKPFLSDKGSYGNENYSLSENGQITKDEREISEIFNDYYPLY